MLREFNRIRFTSTNAINSDKKKVTKENIKWNNSEPIIFLLFIYDMLMYERTNVERIIRRLIN